MSRAREIVQQLADTAGRPLSATEIRHHAKERDPSLDTMLVACAVADLRRERRITLAG